MSIDLHTIKRFIRALVPHVVVIRGEKMPPGLMGLASGSVILYNRDLRGRERALTLLHELAHFVLDTDFRGGLAEREQWREDRADRYAEETLAKLENGGAA